MRRTTEPIDELHTAIATGNLHAVADVASRNVWRLFSTHFDELIDAVKSMPSTMLRHYPALYLVHPSSAVTIRSTRPLQVADFNSYQGVAGEEAAMCTALQMIAARTGGDLVTATTYGKFLSRLIQLDRVGDTNAGDSPIWFFHEQFGSTLLCVGSTEAALEQFAIARQHGEVRGNVDAVRTTAGRTAIAHAMRGSVDDADMHLKIAEQLPPLSAAFHRNAQSTERTARALIAVERMSPDAGKRIQELDSVDVFDVIWPFIFAARARHQLAMQRPTDALETIRATQNSHLVQPGTLAADLIDSLRIHVELILGNVDSARAVVEGARRPGPATRMAQVQVALHDSNLAEAHRCFRAISTDSLNAEQLAQLQMIRAIMESVEHGEVSAGVAGRIVEFARTHQHRRLFACTPANVIENVRVRLDESTRARFDEALDGLTFLLPVTARPALTSAERRLLDALGVISSTAGVAAHLGVSPNTVKTQLRSVFRKLGVASREQALAKASGFSLFGQPEEIFSRSSTLVAPSESLV